MSKKMCEDPNLVQAVHLHTPHPHRRPVSSQKQPWPLATGLPSAAWCLGEPQLSAANSGSTHTEAHALRMRRWRGASWREGRGARRLWTNKDAPHQLFTYLCRHFLQDSDEKQKCPGSSFPCFQDN